MSTNLKKKSGPMFYFTQETEDAIVEYNRTTDEVLRNKLYSEKIHPALYKMAEIMIHRFKFYNFDVSHEDVKHEVVVHMHDKLSRYDQTTGYKAYSFFSIVAKHYLIAENNKNYYQKQKKDTVDAIDVNRNVVNEVIRSSYIEEQIDFIDMFVELMDKYLPTIFPKQRDMSIADSVMYLFKSRDTIENYNKKALYILIRERTGAKSQHITSVINKIKSLYSKLYHQYDDGVNIAKLDWYELKDIIDD